MNDYKAPHPAALAMMEYWEEYRREAYKDSNGVWTVGFGHGARFGTPPEVKEGTIVETEDEARLILIQDMMVVGRYVHNYLTVEVDERQFWALVSVVYNIGAGNFRDSNLRKVINAGASRVDSGPGFYDFIYAEHRDTHLRTPLRGLARRRLCEELFFMSKDTDKPLFIWETPRAEPAKEIQLPTV